MTINEAQQNYTTIEEELLALAYAIEKFLPYLLCSKVIVYTNHFTLKHLPDKKDSKPYLTTMDPPSPRVCTQNLGQERQRECGGEPSLSIIDFLEV